VVELARQTYGKGGVTWGGGQEGPHEAGWLALETAKVRHTLGIAPRWQLGTSVERTLTWYRRCEEGQDVRSLCLQDIADFEAVAAQGSSA
jgi:CDP-glucose 4,6-dehydratase